MAASEEQKAARREAEIEKNQAEARKHLAEARRMEAEARALEVAAEKAEIALVDVRESDAFKRAGDDYHRVYMFSGGVNAQSVEVAINTLTAWSRMFPGEPFEIIFNSPGGGIIEGMRLFDFIRYLSDSGHEITTGATGMAASMGGILVQAGDIRWTSKESWYLIHRAAFAAGGKTFEVEDEVEFVKAIEKRIIKIFVERSKLTERQVKGKWERKDWWLNSDELLELGLVDRIGRKAA